MAGEVERAYERAVEQLLSDETVLGALPEEQIEPLLDAALARLEQAAARSEDQAAFAAAFDQVRSDLRSKVMAAAEATEGDADPVADAPPLAKVPTAATTDVTTGGSNGAPSVPSASGDVSQEPAWELPETLGPQPGWEDVAANAGMAYAQNESDSGRPDERATAAGGDRLNPPAPEPVSADVGVSTPDEIEPVRPENVGSAMSGSGAETDDRVDAAHGVVAGSAPPQIPADKPADDGLVEETREALHRFGARLRGLFGREQDG